MGIAEYASVTPFNPSKGNAMTRLFCIVMFAFTALGARAEEPVHAVFLLHEREYKSAETVPAFANEELVKKHGWKCTFVIDSRPNQLNGTEAVKNADVLFISVRRQALTPEQLTPIRAYIEAGKPVVGIRTASHAWTLREDAPEGHVQWTEFDRDVLGGNYHAHYPKDFSSPDVSTTWSDPDSKHPILKGVDPAKRNTACWHYQVRPLAETTEVLAWGQHEDNEPEPVAWTNTNIYGGRVFYTSLGHPDDFDTEAFRTMLANGMLWAAGKLSD